MSRFIAPSILAADFTNLGQEISFINKSNAHWLHCDVMDGVFVPNISFGIPVVQAAKRISEKPLDVHLMIVEPERYVGRFCEIGVDILTIHYEACKNLRRTVREIKDFGVRAGVALSPHTPVEVLAEIIEGLDLVLIMSVSPGFGGQKFIEGTYEKVIATKELILKTNSEALIEVDGGIDFQNAGKLFDCGVNILVTGSTVFKSGDPVGTVNKLLSV